MDMGLFEIKKTSALIVPYGIEIEEIRAVKKSKGALIVPYGIEIYRIIS